MLRLVIASILAAAFACVPIPEAPSGSISIVPPVTVVTAHKAVHIVPARDGGMTCLTADDVRRLQVYLDHCPRSTP